MLTFDHFNFNVSDLDKSLAFYKEALGLEPVGERKTAEDGSFEFGKSLLQRPTRALHFRHTAPFFIHAYDTRIAMAFQVMAAIDCLAF